MRVPRLPQLPVHKLPGAPNTIETRRPASEKKSECEPSAGKSAHCRLIGHKTHEVEKRLLRHSRQSGRNDDTGVHGEGGRGMAITPCENRSSPCENRSSSQGEASNAALATARQQEPNINGSDMMLPGSQVKAASGWWIGLVNAVHPRHKPNWVTLFNKAIEGSRPTITFYRAGASNAIYPGYAKPCGKFCFRVKGDENEGRSATQPDGNQNQGSNQSEMPDPSLVTDAAASTCTCNELFRRYYKEYPTRMSKSLNGWFQLFNKLGLRVPSNWLSIVLHTENSSTPRKGSPQLATNDSHSTRVFDEQGDGKGPSAAAQKGKEEVRSSLCLVDLRSSSGSKCHSGSEPNKGNEQQQQEQAPLPTAREQRAFARDRFRTDGPNKSSEEGRAPTTKCIRRRMQKGLPVESNLCDTERERRHTRTGKDLRKQEQKNSRARPREAGILSDEIRGGVNEQQPATGTDPFEIVDIVDIQSTDPCGQESGGKAGKEGNLDHDDEADSREQRTVGSRSNRGEGHPRCKSIGQSEEIIRVVGLENASASVAITPCPASMTVLADSHNASGPSKAGKEVGDTSDYAEVRLGELGGQKARIDAQCHSHLEKGGETPIGGENEGLVVGIHQDDHPDEQEKIHATNKESNGCHADSRLLDIVNPGPMCSLPTSSPKFEGSICGQSRARGSGDALEPIKVLEQEKAEGGGTAEPVLSSSRKGGSHNGSKEMPAGKGTATVSPSLSVSQQNEDLCEDQGRSRDHGNGGYDGGKVPIQDGAGNQCVAGHSASERPCSDSARSSTPEKEPYDLPIRMDEYSCKRSGQDARCRSRNADSLHAENPAHLLLSRGPYFMAAEGRYRPRGLSSAARKAPNYSSQQEYRMRGASAGEYIMCSRPRSRPGTRSTLKARRQRKGRQYDADIETDRDSNDLPVIRGSNIGDEFDKWFAEHAPQPVDQVQPQEDVNHRTAGVKRKSEFSCHYSQHTNSSYGMPLGTHYPPQCNHQNAENLPWYGRQAYTHSSSKRRKPRLHSSSCSSYPPAKGLPSYKCRKAAEVELLCSQRHKCQKLNLRDDGLMRHTARDRCVYDEMLPASPSTPSLSSSSTSLSPSQLIPSSSGRGKRHGSHTSSHRGAVHCSSERVLRHKDRSKMKHLNEWHSHVARLRSKRDGVSTDFFQTSSAYETDHAPPSGLDRVVSCELPGMKMGLVANLENPSALTTANAAVVPAAPATPAGLPHVVSGAGVTSAAAVAFGGRSSTTTGAGGQRCLESDQGVVIAVKKEVADARHLRPGDISKSNVSQRGGGNEPVAAPGSSCFKAADNNANSKVEAIQGHTIICVSSDQRGLSSSTECNKAASIGAPTPCSDNLTAEGHHCSDVSAQPIQGVPDSSALAGSNCDEHRRNHDSHRVECARRATLMTPGSERIQEPPMDDVKHGSAIDRSDHNTAGRGDEGYERVDTGEQPVFREQKLSQTEGEGDFGASVGLNLNRSTIEHVIAGNLHTVIKQLTDQVLLMSREAVNCREDPVSLTGRAKGSPPIVGSAALASVGSDLEKELSCSEQRQEASNMETSRAPTVLEESRGEGTVVEAHPGGRTLAEDIVRTDAMNSRSNRREDIIEHIGVFGKGKDGDSEAQVGDIGGSSSIVDGHDDITSEYLPGNLPEDAEEEEGALGDLVFSSKRQATDGGGAMLREKLTNKCNGTSKENGVVERVPEEEDQCSGRTMEDSEHKPMAFVVAEEEIQGAASRCTSNGTTAMRTEMVQQVNLMRHKDHQLSLGDCLSETLGRHQDSLHALIENMKKELVDLQTPGDEEIILVHGAAIQEILLIAITAEEERRRIFDVLPAFHGVGNRGGCV